MNMNTIFQISNLLTMPFWVLMLIAPGWSWTRRIMGSLWVVVPVALLYAVLLVPQLPALAPALASPTLDAIAAGLGTPEAATVGWAHFLAFDLFVGRWAYLESVKRGTNPWLLLVGALFHPDGRAAGAAVVSRAAAV